MCGLAFLSMTLVLLPIANFPPAIQSEGLSFNDLFSQGIRLHSQGEYEKSYEAFRQALVLSHEKGYQVRTGGCLIRMGLLKWNLGDDAGSARHFEQATAFFSQNLDLRSREFCLMCLKIIRLQNLGRAARKAKLPYQALDQLSEAVSLGRALGFPDLEVKCLRQLALAYLEIGDLTPFFENSRRGLALASMINHRLEQGRFLNNIGVYYQHHLEYPRAISSLEKALEMVQAANDPEAEADILNNLGLLHQELGNIDRARYYLQEAMVRDQANQALDPVAMDLANIGSALCGRGVAQGHRQDLLDAQDALQKSLLIQSQRPPNPLIAFATLNNLGVVLDELGDYPGARQRFEQGLKIAGEGPQPFQRAHALVNIAASFLNEGDLRQAQFFYQSAHQESSRGHLANVLMESCFGLGQCYERSGDPELALSYYRCAIAALEGVRAKLPEPLIIGYSRDKFRSYERVADILFDLAQGNASAPPAEQMFSLFESAKARALLEGLQEAHADVPGTDLQHLRDRLKALDRNISELASRLKGLDAASEDKTALKVELEREEDESVRLSLELRETEPGPAVPWGCDPRHLGEVQQLLSRERAVLLEYFLGERRSYLLRISATDVRLYQLPARAGLERSLRAYIKSMSDQSLDPKILSDAAERIGREVLPVDDETFRTAKSIIVVPDGILHYLAFETLRLRDGSGLSYLVEGAAVSYSPSASVMAILEERTPLRSWSKEVLAVGPPARSRPPLPFGQREVQDVAGTFAAGTADMLSGEDVDESSLKTRPLSDYRIIHFACHGDLDEAFPLRSSLVLSARAGSDDDGLLQMREIYRLKLQAELVVLSACQTGRGRFERSEGPLALARPFFFAGAHAVIASLWSINDRSTLRLMAEFYREIGAGRGASEALRTAKLRMLKSRWAHPFYWAGFLLQGDPSAAGARSSIGQRSND